MSANPFILISPSTRGLSLALVRRLLMTTSLPIYATHRASSPDFIRANVLSGLESQSASLSGRLHLLPLDLTSEESIRNASEILLDSLPKGKKSYLHRAYFTGGILHPERQPSDLDLAHIQETFQINVMSHLLLIKYFSQFLPPPVSSRVDNSQDITKWIHVSARVGSISDNRLGSWYSYRASKAALNQVIHTFDLYLQAKRIPAMCVGVHPGTVKTDLSRPFVGGQNTTGKDGTEKGGGKVKGLFEKEEAAERIVTVVEELRASARGKIWDWKGEEVLP